MDRLERFWEWIFPSNLYCICCGSIIDNTRTYGLCDRCVRKFHWLDKKTCVKCGKILEDGYTHEKCVDCRTMDHRFIKGYTCARYGLYERILMMEYKYKDKAWIGRKVGDILADRIKDEGLAPDLVVPVPIHKTREARRGYNQVDIMARIFAARMGWPVDNRTLVRTKNTLPMRNLGVPERVANVEDAFALRPGRAQNVVNKSILLIDDIYTTGSTADSCAKTLLEGGAREIRLLTFAAGSNVIPSDPN